MHKYVIMGIQGSGKGTQAQLLAAELDLVHLSVGDVFRWNVEQHTKLGAQVRTSVRRIHFAITSGCPNKDEFELAHIYLQRAFSSA